MRFAALLLIAAVALPGAVRVLDDFESPDSAKRWTGSAAVTAERATHGKQSLRLRFEQARTEAGMAVPVRDWSGFDRLLFDVFTDREGPQALSLRIYQEGGTDLDHYFDARSKLILLKGWNHIEVKLPLQAASFQRELALDRIDRLAISVDRTRLPWTVDLDNLRLVKGAEDAATASRAQPQETVTIVDNRWYTVRQVARAEDVPESAEVKRLRADAERELARLEEIIRAAQAQGIDTIYEERHLVTADLGLRVRPRLAWYNNDRKKTELFTYVAESCRAGRQHLEDLLAGVVRLPHTDDTQVGEPLVPLYPPLKGSPRKGWFFTDPRDIPMFVISLHSPSRSLERFFATPLQHIESYTVGGGSRWTIEESPVYEAFHKHDDAKRVGWDGWCGHLIRDLHSMGGSKMENVVICLESPQIREAVDKFIRLNVPKFHANPQLLYDIMAYELMYICYCDRSQKMFRKYIADKHGSIAGANKIYGTSYRSFDDVVAPPVKNSRPLPDTNRALWYDWARYNMDRFTGYLLWVRSRIRELDATVPLAAGGSSSMLAGRTGTTGIDEERIVNEVDDLIIHEGAGSTFGMDLQLAFAETPKPLADPEMNLESVHDLLPHALHGKSVMQFFHWPVQPPNEFLSTVSSSLPHSWRFRLDDIGELIRSTLDARRLSREISSFVETPAEVAILYSQTSTLQLPPEMLTWSRTPYLAELEKTYESSLCLDAKTTFVTERQIRKGWLKRYKLLLVPAVRNIPADVVETIRAWTSEGGRVLLTPESFIGDEYNRPANYLQSLGLQVSPAARPKPVVGAMVQGYDQSFSQDVAFPPGSETKVGPSTVARIKLGQGMVYYSAASLEERSYAKLLETLFQEAGVNRPVRARSDDPETWKVEARYARSGAREFAYLVNHHDRTVTVSLETPGKQYREMEDLRERRRQNVQKVTILGHQTAIFELF